MMKKNVFLGSVVALGLFATVFAANSAFAIQDNISGMRMGNGMGMMMNNQNSDNYQKMSEMHSLMAQGKYDEAGKNMQNMGINNCPMSGGNGMMSGNVVK